MITFFDIGMLMFITGISIFAILMLIFGMCTPEKYEKIFKFGTLISILLVLFGLIVIGSECVHWVGII